MARLTNISISNDSTGIYQPKRKNQWYVEIAPPNSTNFTTFAIKSTGLPGGTFNEVVIDYMNSKFYFPGKWEWETISMTLRDFIGENSSQKLYDWFTSQFSPEKGGQAMGGEVKSNIIISLLDPRGSVIERWTLMGAFLKEAKWGDLDYSDDGERELTITIRYDYATLQSDVNAPNNYNINLEEDDTNSDI